MNQNRITTTDFSNPESKALYHQDWHGEDGSRPQHERGQQQCGECAFFAPFNEDYGLCCNNASRHMTETVFEHFTCPACVSEGWGPHSFSHDNEFRCRCQGEPIYDTVLTIITLLDRDALDDELRSHLSALRQFLEKSPRPLR